MACIFLCWFGRYCAPATLHSNLKKSPTIPLTSHISSTCISKRQPSSFRLFSASSFSSLAAEVDLDIRNPVADGEANGTESLATDKEGHGVETQKQSFFPKKNQVVELVCESLAFKGKGVCKIADSGFVVMCDRALPGERFLGRVTRMKKGSYAEMEFSFGTKRWVPRDTLHGQDVHDADIFALGLHVPGRFDKILHINKCLLQHKVANQVLAMVQEYWQDPTSNLSPYDVHTHKGFLKHLTLRMGRY